jgi:hypothetical protein
VVGKVFQMLIIIGNNGEHTLCAARLARLSGGASVADQLGDDFRRLCLRFFNSDKTRGFPYEPRAGGLVEKGARPLSGWL